MLNRENLDAVLLNAQHNFAWLTSGSSNGIDLSRENGAASLLVTRTGKRYIITNNVEMPRMLAEEIAVDDFEPAEYAWQDEKAGGDTPLRIAKDLSGGEIATDIALFAGSLPIEGKIATCRFGMTTSEVERYRELGRDAGAAVRRVIDRLTPGESEIEIAAKLRFELASKNIMSVVTLVAADERIARFRHPVPTVNTWKKTLLMVTCAKRNGLIVSLSRIVCAREVPDELRERTEANAYINACMLDATTPGNTGSTVYAVAAKAYADQGFADEIDRHHQGGATGYKTREWVAHPLSSDIVHLDQPFAWNPTITGTKVEETCLVTASGIERISTSPDFPQIVTVIKGHEYYSPGILSL